MEKKKPQPGWLGQGVSFWEELVLQEVPDSFFL